MSDGDLALWVEKVGVGQIGVQAQGFARARDEAATEASTDGGQARRSGDVAGHDGLRA
jgi:hypothetical protein